MIIQLQLKISLYGIKQISKRKKISRHCLLEEGNTVEFHLISYEDEDIKELPELETLRI